MDEAKIIEEDIITNGISLNGVKANDVSKMVTKEDFNDNCLIIQKGKKQFKKIVIK